MNESEMVWLNVIQYMYVMARKGNLKNLVLTDSEVQAPVYIREMGQSYTFRVKKTPISTGLRYELSVVVNGARAICFVRLDGLLMDSPTSLSIPEFECLVSALSDRGPLEDKIKSMEKRIQLLEDRNRSLFDSNMKLQDKLAKIRGLL